MPKTDHIQLGFGEDAERIPILYEDRSIIAIDKPAGWMLVPTSWQRTSRNLQTAIISSIAGGEFWARSRNLRFLRYIHRLDGETTGILLFGKSQGAVHSFGRLFESRQVLKTYLAVVEASPARSEWTCSLKLGPDPREIGRIRVDAANGKEAETVFRVLTESTTPGGVRTLIEASPTTGRTHQIRVHLASAKLPIVGDKFYGSRAMGTPEFPIALRASTLEYTDPFTKRRVRIRASNDAFLRAFGLRFKLDQPAPTANPSGAQRQQG